MNFLREYISLITSIYFITTILSALLFFFISNRFKLAKRIYTILRIIERPFLISLCHIIFIVLGLKFLDLTTNQLYYVISNIYFINFIDGLIFGFFIGFFNYQRVKIYEEV